MDVHVAENLWALSLQPEGVLERWFVANDEPVHLGQTLAMVMIEQARHEIIAPAAGLLHRYAKAGDVIDPGCVIARIDRANG